MANTDRTMHVHAFMAETTGLTMMGGWELYGFSMAERLLGSCSGALSANRSVCGVVRSVSEVKCMRFVCGVASDRDAEGGG